MRRSEFRLICASNRDLLEETRQGNFRRDLYFRINVFPIAIPPLRERPEDIPGLVHHLLAVLGAPDIEISREVMQLLEQYHWPGNIRELRNLLERALILSRGSQLTSDHFAGLEYAPVAVEESVDTSDLTKVEEAHIKIVMQRFGNDTKKAAEALGISRATLYRKLKKLKE
jgi:DNA-binding NtrC family response regulator